MASAYYLDAMSDIGLDWPMAPSRQTLDSLHLQQTALDLGEVRVGAFYFPGPLQRLIGFAAENVHLPADSKCFPSERAAAGTLGFQSMASGWPCF
jgi:hypothetical protein